MSEQDEAPEGARSIIGRPAPTSPEEIEAIVAGLRRMADEGEASLKTLSALASGADHSGGKFLEPLSVENITRCIDIACGKSMRDSLMIGLAAALELREILKRLGL